ncbi:MAG: M23 family metallopeptidase [Anaerolineae bacterium]|nr:M23 family metallopeptidase [Anaerolineae bacterium]MBT7070133.1 M23 family metallopeptidase [Anaerolineae bacterium]MBT7326183.1 M23 family metallopeptidase [Anaerolineae bacterium]
MLLLFLTVLISACAPTSTPPPTTATFISATAIKAEIPPTLTPTLEPSPTVIMIPTGTPIPCDAYETFCVEDAHFWLPRPIGTEYQNEVERGYRYGSTINGKRDPHHGVEFINELGTPTLAVADGRVLYAAEDRPAIYAPWERFYGNLVIIQHEFPTLDVPLYTFYAHLSSINVVEGERVKTGQTIGNVGMSGGAIGSHLHFEVRLGENYSDTRNPELWLQPLDETCGGIVVRIHNQNEKQLRVPVVVERVGVSESDLEWVASLEAYAAESDPVGMDDLWQETHAIADLPAGEYRVSFSYAGQYWERFVEVHPDKVTAIYFLIEE